MSSFVVIGPGYRQPGRQHQLILVLIGGLSALLALTGACNTGELALAHRLTLWGLIVTLNVVQTIGLFACLRHVSRGARKRPGTAAVVAAVFTSALMTAELHALKYTPLLPKAPDPPLAFFAFVAPISISVSLLALLAQRLVRRDRTTAPRRVSDLTLNPATETVSSRQRPSARVPDGWPAEPVLRVSAEDHYLDIVTTGERRLVRGTLSEAIAALPDRCGMQVHRSHWLALAHIDRLARRGRDVDAVLKDGERVPVSRSRVAALRKRLASD